MFVEVVRLSAGYAMQDMHGILGKSSLCRQMYFGEDDINLFSAER